VYVALPRPYATAGCIARATADGLGVLMVDESMQVSEMLAPQRARHFAPLLAAVLRDRWSQIEEIRDAAN
jgi:hypothetical protein